MKRKEGKTKKLLRKKLKKSESQEKQKNFFVHTSHLQKGGLTIYRGDRLRGGHFSLHFLVPIGKSVGKTALKLGKKIFKNVAPKVAKTVLETGEDVLSGKTNLRSALKQGVKKGRRQLASSTHEALIEELKRYESKQKGRGGLIRKRKFPCKIQLVKCEDTRSRQYQTEWELKKTGEN